MLAAKSAVGAEVTTNEQFQSSSHSDYYRANELSIDAFGSASMGKYSIDHLSGARVRHDTRLGAGVGVTYFINRYFGLGADIYSEDTRGSFIDSTSVNLIARLPLGQSGFAPYAFGGVGYQFDMNKVWFGQFGAGLEYRFTRNIGAFLDARMVFPDETGDYGLARLGLRFSF